LGAEAGPIPGAFGATAAPDLEPQEHRAVQGDDGPTGRGSRPERPGAGGTEPGVGGQVYGPIGARSGVPPGHGVAPRGDRFSRSNESITSRQTGFASLEKGLPKELTRLRAILAKGLEATADLWPDIRV